MEAKSQSIIKPRITTLVVIAIVGLIGGIFLYGTYGDKDKTSYVGTSAPLEPAIPAEEIEEIPRKKPGENVVTEGNLLVSDASAEELVLSEDDGQFPEDPLSLEEIPTKEPQENVVTEGNLLEASLDEIALAEDHEQFPEAPLSEEDVQDELQQPPTNGGEDNYSRIDTKKLVQQGHKFREGRGVARDFAKAVELYRKAAVEGDPEGQFFLGNMYGWAEGVERDYVEAAKWYQKAADQGHPFSQAYLGHMYEKGNGVPKNEATAIRLYGKAARQSTDKHAKQYAETKLKSLLLRRGEKGLESQLGT